MGKSNTAGRWNPPLFEWRFAMGTSTNSMLDFPAKHVSGAHKSSQIIHFNSIFHCNILTYYVNLGKFHHDLTVLPKPGTMVKVRGIIPKWPQDSA